jgi:hypothetical protein
VEYSLILDEDGNVFALKSWRRALIQTSILHEDSWPEQKNQLDLA